MGQRVASAQITVAAIRDGAGYTNNLLLNSDFAAEKEHWFFYSNAALDASMAREGRGTVKLESAGLTAHNYAGLTQTSTNGNPNLLIGGGKTITASLWSYTDDLSTFEQYGASFEVDCYAADNRRLAVISWSCTPTAENEWQRFTGTRVLPEGTARVRCYIYLSRNGRIWINSPKFELGDNPDPQWSLAASELPGKDGKDGTSVVITSTEVRYSTNHASATQPAESTFTLTTVPTLTAGQYLWSRTVVTYNNGQSTRTYGVSRVGENGQDGTAWGNGKMLYTDPTFKKGKNSCTVYNNKAATNNNVTIDWEEDTTAPNDSGRVLRIRNTGEAAPGLGGFHQNIQSRPSATFVQRFVAKIPVGYTVENAQNAMGSNPKFTWLTPRTGTGKWEEYLMEVKCGESGTFKNGGYICLKGSPAGTAEAPVEWLLAYATIFDMDANGEFLIESQSVRYAKSTTAVQPADGAFTATSVGALNLAPGEYMWSKTEVAYSDGTVTKSYAVSRVGSDGETGTPGPAGADGKSTYFHQAYANSADGTAGFSTTYFKDALYMGTCSDYTAADPTTPASYEWARLRGEDGVSAKSVMVTGEQVFTYKDDFATLVGPQNITLTATLQGTTGYAWSYSRDGGNTWTAFASPNGQTVTFGPSSGVFSSGNRSAIVRCASGGVWDEITVVKVSSGSNGEDGSNYTSNLFTGTKDFSGKWVNPNNRWSVSAEELPGFTVMEATDLIWGRLYQPYTVEYGKTYTFSVWVKVDYTAGDITMRAAQSNHNNTTPTHRVITDIVKDGEWHYLGVVFKATDPDDLIVHCGVETGTSGNTIYVAGYKLEEGENQNPVWSPNADEMVGEDAYTVLLTNESHTFEGDTQKAVAAATECGVIAYKGATRVAASIGTVTGAPAGMTVTVSGNGGTGAKLTVAVTTALTQRQGTLTVPVTVDGKQFTKVMSWSLSLQGRGISGTTEWYAVGASSTTPPADSAFVQSPVPQTTETNRYLWNYERTTYTDNTFSSTEKHVISVHGANGKPGAGITGVVNYLLASDKAHGVTTAEPGWTTDASSTAATVSAAKPYLWNYERVTYTEGNPTETAPHVVGHWGSDGSSYSNNLLTGTHGAELSVTNGGNVVKRFDTVRNFKDYPAGTVLTVSFDYEYSGVSTGSLYNTLRFGFEAHIGVNAAGNNIYLSAWRNLPADSTGLSDSGRHVGKITIPSGASVDVNKANFYIQLAGGACRIWNFKIEEGANDNPQWTPAAGEMVAPRITEEYYLSTSATALTGGSWQPSKPAWVEGRYYWTRSKITYGTGEVEYTDAICVTGQSGTSVLAQYSADGSTWHATYAIGDAWMRTSRDNGATWTPGIRIVGQDGAPGAKGDKGDAGAAGRDGSYTVWQWALGSLTAPKEAWSDTPLTAKAGEYVWMRSGTVTPPGTVAEWMPGYIRITGDSGQDGESTYLMDLSNEVVAIACDAQGMPVTGGPWTSQIRVYKGGSQDSGWTYSAVTQGCTLDSGDYFLQQGAVYVSAMTADTATVTVTATKAGCPTLTAVMTLYKVIPGRDGSGAKSVTVNADAQVFTYKDDFATLVGPQNITLTATLQGTTGYAWSYKTPSMAAFADLSHNAQSFTLSHNAGGWGSDRSMTLRCTSGGVHDEVTIAKVSSGANGKPGTAGADAYTVLLSNESHTFAGGTTAALGSTTMCDVIAYKGAAQVAATIGTITGAPAGMTVTVSGNGSTSAGFTVAVTTALTTKQGVLKVPVTVDGKTFTKEFSWSLALKGTTGAAGAAAVVYSILTSTDTVTRNPDGSLTETTVTCTKYKTTGAGAMTATTEKYLYAQVNTREASGSWQLVAGSGQTSGSVNITGKATAVVWELRSSTATSGYTVLDRERVAVLTDGGEIEATGENLLLNSDFADCNPKGTADGEKAAHWMVQFANARVNTDTAMLHEGKNSIYLPASYPDYQFLYQRKAQNSALGAIEGGRYLTWSAWVYAKQLGASGSMTVNMKSVLADGTETHDYRTWLPTAAGRWERVEHTRLLPEGTVETEWSVSSTYGADVWIAQPKLEYGERATGWCRSERDFDAIKAALQNKGTTEGGLILGSMIRLGYNTAGGYRTMAGVNGVYNDGAAGGGLAFFAGGDMKDAALPQNAVAEDRARAAIRHDGSAYFADNTLRLSENHVEVGDYLHLQDDGMHMVIEGKEMLRVGNVPVEVSASDLANTRRIIFTDTPVTNSALWTPGAVAGILKTPTPWKIKHYAEGAHWNTATDATLTLPESSTVSFQFEYRSQGESKMYVGTLRITLWRVATGGDVAESVRNFRLNNTQVDSTTYEHYIEGAVSFTIKTAGDYYVTGQFVDDNNLSGTEETYVTGSFFAQGEITRGVSTGNVLGNNGLASIWGNNAALYMNDTNFLARIGNYGIHISATEIKIRLGGTAWKTLGLSGSNLTLT